VPNPGLFRKPNAESRKPVRVGIELKNPSEIEHMRMASRVVARTLELLAQAAIPGTTLEELDRLAHERIRATGTTSSFLGYRGYPKVLCASVNEGVVHCIPDRRRLREGDIVGLDFGVSHRGYHGDAAITVAVGRIPPEAERLMQTTREALALAIEAVRPGNRTGDIGAAVEAHAGRAGYSVVRAFVGHGIGRRMHEEPQVPNFGPGGRGPRLRPGMVLAIEPMLNQGTDDVEVLADGWSAVTKDRRLSAHFEHTVLVTADGCEVLTRADVVGCAVPGLRAAAT